MISSIAPQTTAVSAPPSWVKEQVPGDDGVPTHFSMEHVLAVHAPDGSDAGLTYAALEQVGDCDPAIRLQGAADQPMTLAQAWRQSLILQDLVRRALGGAR